MSARCPAITRSGERCTLSVDGASGYCHLHDPARREQRRRAASKAGKARPNKEFQEVRELLRELTGAVLSGEVKTGVAAVANQLLNSRLRLVELERRTADLEALLERLERLEELAGRLGRVG